MVKTTNTDNNELTHNILSAFKDNEFLDEISQRSGKHIVTINHDDVRIVVKKFDFSYMPVAGREPLIPVNTLYEHETAVLRTLSDFNQHYIHHFEEDHYGYLAMTRIDGTRVDKYLTTHPEQAEEIFFKCLEYVLHTFGYLHGDLQPAHFLIDEQQSVHLIDYGLAGKLPNGYENYPGQLVYFASPEVCQFMSDSDTAFTYSQASEMFSFGTTMAYALTRKLPTIFPKGVKNTSFEDKKRRGCRRLA